VCLAALQGCPDLRGDQEGQGPQGEEGQGQGQGRRDARLHSRRAARRRAAGLHPGHCAHACGRAARVGAAYGEHSLPPRPFLLRCVPLFYLEYIPCPTLVLVNVVVQPARLPPRSPRTRHLAAAVDLAHQQVHM
jgi:hypothetical protein